MREVTELVRPVFKVRALAELPGYVIPNIERAATWHMPHLKQLGTHSGTAVVVGAGPSVEGQLDRIRELYEDPKSVVFPINCMHRWLLDRGVFPGIQVLFEADADLGVVLGKTSSRTTYYVCSSCPPAHRDYLLGSRCVLWHHWEHHREYQDTLARLFPGEDMVGGGYTTLFRILNIALALGFRRFELFGVDSSFMRDDQQNIPGYPTHPSGENTSNVWVGGQCFRSSGALTLQAEMVMSWLRENRSTDLEVKVHGDGLLPHMYRMMYNADKH